MTDVFLAHCRELIGAEHVLTGDADVAPYLTDWRGRFTGRARAVLRPADPQQVAGLVRLCAAHRVPVVPQGGRTGLVIGSVPDESGKAVVLSLRRLNRIRAVDPINRTMTVDAGCILHDIQQAAAAQGMLFPLSLAAEGSCTIGGNLATNAGGTGVLRYGNTRELCLGLEVVTAHGELWDGLRGLRKDNTGYDLRDLYHRRRRHAGRDHRRRAQAVPAAEGRHHGPGGAGQLPRRPRTAGHGPGNRRPDPDRLRADERRQPAPGRQALPALPHPFPQTHPQYALLELSSHESEQHAVRLLEETIENALEAGLAQDAVVATSIAQSRALWAIREHIPLAQAADGKNIKHDISVPISRIADFVETTDALLARAWPGVQVVCFGHLGDGNLHYNIAPPAGTPHEAFLAYQGDVNRIVHDSVAAHGGSISAEHGIGALKRDELPRYKAQVELDLMRAIKAALDPLGIMNPGKIL
jgi:FAD/FMN-containing dehydrogenase